METILLQLSQWLLDYANANQGATIATVLMSAGWVIAVIAAFLPAPTESSSTLYRIIYVPINFIAMNIGKSKNHDDMITRK